MAGRSAEVVVSVRLARVLALMGKLTDLRDLGLELMRELPQLENNRWARVAVRELVAVTLNSSPQLPTSDHVYSKIQGGAPHVGAPRLVT